MKLVYPMRLQGAQGATEIGSLDEFITRLTAENAGSFLLGNNRLWHGGVHLSDQGGWSSQGEVRAIAEGEIVAYRLASQAAAIMRAPDPGQGEQAVTIQTSPSFCLIRHHYEASENVSGQQQTRHNPLTFYSLYMHLACDCAYGAAATRHVITGDKVCIYEAVTHTTDHAELQLIPSYQRDAAGNLTSTRRHAKQGAEVTRLSEPGEYLNDRHQRHRYQLVRYKTPMPGEPEAFFIATQFLQAEQPQRPAWMTPPEAKPERYRTASNSWIRQIPSPNSPLRGLPAHSEVVTLAEPSTMIALGGGLKEFVKVQIYQAGSGTVKDGGGHVMTNGAPGECYWLAAERLGSLLPAETPEPIQRDRVVDCQQSPIPVKAGDLIGHWGEHEYAQPTANGLKVVAEKAVHLEVLVAAQDESALRACLNNQGGLSGGQPYLLLPPGEEVDTFALPASGGYQRIGTFGPRDAPMPVNHSDLVTQGSARFVKVAEGQHVLIGGTTQLVSQHDWAKLGVRLVNGSQDSDGFLSAVDTDHLIGSDFFASLYRQVITDQDDASQPTTAAIQQALHHKSQAVRKLFIKHDSEWLKRSDWSRHEQELADAPNQLAYLKAYNEQMAWADDTSSLLGEQPWFIHPAGMMGLITDPVSDDEMDEKWLTVPKGQLTFDAEGNDIDTSIYFSRHPHVPNNRGVVIGASGVTYGRGLDLGQISISELNKLTKAISDNCNPLSSSMLQWLTDAVGLQRQAAYNYTIAINDVVPRNEQTLTRKQQHYLFNEIYLKLDAIAKRTIENPKGTRTRAVPNGVDLDPEKIISWVELPQRIKDVLVDITFRGDNRPSTREFFIPNLIESIKNNDDFSAFKENIKSNRWKETFNVPLDRYQRRCNYL
ncbi:pesticin C-terminus-like muramidase [Pseudaeromonas paramecii]|uniref:Pesticin C-terminus-like muramidase n=1 Tax=Pseudaeromonas paramecii TaxID=2138166 RepID=A0ABP8Q8X3_9GAMM